jgi:uncharacterized membrane protein
MGYSPGERETIYKHFHTSMKWTNLGTVLLGIWLLSAPETFGYGNLPISYSDWISSILLIFFGMISLKYKYRQWIWGSAAVGLWLQLAPLVFWAHDPVIYVNDTLIGMLAIGLCILVPKRPAKFEIGPQIPKGWTYNPSSWQQRIPVMLFGLIAWFLGRYLAGYQLQYTDYLWTPSAGTEKVLTSLIAKDFPISDAGLGALVYSLEALMAAKGGVRRWHTMPWLVLSFSILVVPVGFVSIFLVMCQPIVVGAWCDICLVIALCMLIMLTLTVDEVVAVTQYLSQSVKEGKSFWKTLFYGSQYEQDENDVRTPPLDGSVFHFCTAMLWGVTFPWNCALCALIGIAFLFVNPFLGFEGVVSNSAVVMSALIGVISIISFAEVARALRYFNLLLALWLIVGSFALTGASLMTGIVGLVVGGAVIALSLLKGPKIQEKYGSWNSWIF